MSFAYKNGKNKGDRKRHRKKDIEKDWKQSENKIDKNKEKMVFMRSWCILNSAGHILDYSSML